MLALDDYFAELQPRIQGDLRRDDYSRLLYSTDASIYQVMPHGVLIPQTVDDVQAAVELAAATRCRSCRAPGAAAWPGRRSTRRWSSTSPAIWIRFWRSIRKSSGCGCSRASSWTSSTYLQPIRPAMFGPDPASSNRACMGGIVSNNSTGSHSILYGMTADHVLEMAVILADGTQTHFGPLDTAVQPPIPATQRSGRPASTARVRLTLVAANQEIIRQRHAAPLAALRRLQPGPTLLSNGRPTYRWPSRPAASTWPSWSAARKAAWRSSPSMKLNLVPAPTHGPGDCPF
jgi:hypothetical protein